VTPAMVRNDPASGKYTVKCGKPAAIAYPSDPGSDAIHFSPFHRDVHPCLVDHRRHIINRVENEYAFVGSNSVYVPSRPLDHQLGQQHIDLTAYFLTAPSDYRRPDRHK
jgi:hypothetical protein